MRPSSSGYGGRGGFRDEGPPAEVVEVSSFLRASEGEAETMLTNEKVPRILCPIYLQNKIRIGRVRNVFGSINEPYVSIKMKHGVAPATSYSVGDKFYSDPADLLPLVTYFSQSANQRRQNRSWSDIACKEILYNIFRRLTIVDFVRAGKVCKSWLSASLERTECWPMLEPPWVIPSCWLDDKVDVVFCPSEKCLLKAPHSNWELIRSSGYLGGSSTGWFGLERVEIVRIVHSLSGTELPLPPLSAIPGVSVLPTDSTSMGRKLAYPAAQGGTMWHYLTKPKKGVLRLPKFFDCIFIVPPPDGGDRNQMAVFAVCSKMGRVLFTRLHGNAWSFVDMPEPVSNSIVNLTSHQGSVYAVDAFGRVAAWDYRGGAAQAEADANAPGPLFSRIVIDSGPPQFNQFLRERFLVVEANGDLLQVIGIVRQYRVFRLEQSGGHHDDGRVWCGPLQHLGNDGTAVFVAPGFSSAFTCSDFPWLKKDCLYFPVGIYNMRDDMFEIIFHHSPNEESGGWIQSGVYSMKSRVLERQRFPESPSGQSGRWIRGNWLVPVLQSPRQAAIAHYRRQ